MKRLRLLAATALVALLLASVTTSAGPLQASDEGVLPAVPDGEDLDADCAPPCGYIWPRIGVHSDVRSPYPVSEISDFPSQFDVQVTYSWDIEQEGTGLNDVTEQMEVLIVITRTPEFMRAQIDRNVCDFTLVPVISEYEVCELTVTVEIDETKLPTSEEELRETGHRLMLFAASDESGTFMRSYGLEDIRFRFDDDAEGQTGQTGGPSGTGAQAEEAPAPVALLLVGALAAGLAIHRARRWTRRD